MTTASGAAGPMCEKCGAPKRKLVSPQGWIDFICNRCDVTPSLTYQDGKYHCAVCGTFQVVLCEHWQKLFSCAADAIALAAREHQPAHGEPARNEPTGPCGILPSDSAGLLGISSEKLQELAYVTCGLNPAWMKDRWQALADAINRHGLEPPVRRGQPAKAEPGTPARNQLTFVEALQIVQGGFDVWKKRNPKWFKRIDGTPIPNDLPVVIADVLSSIYIPLRDEAGAATATADAGRELTEALEMQKAELLQVIEDRAIHRAHPAEGEVSTGDEPWECVLCGADAEKQDDIQHHVTCPLRAATGQKAADAGLRKRLEALNDDFHAWNIGMLSSDKFRKRFEGTMRALGLSADSPKQS